MDLDALYNQFREAKEQQKQENFKVFMTTLVYGLVSDLDTCYASGDVDKYNTLVNNIKSRGGFRIFRNSEGKHKLEISI